MRRPLVIAALLWVLVPTVRAQCMLSSTSPFQPGPDGYGQATLAWSAPSASRVQVRVGSSSGDVVADEGPSGTVRTGRWVTAGTKFYLQDVTSGAPGTTLSTLTIGARTTDRDMLHYLVATSGSSNLSTPGDTLGVLIFERDTLDQLGRVDVSAQTFPAATSPDGRTLYLAVLGGNPGIASLDLLTFTTRSFLPIPGLQGLQPAGPSRLLARTASGLLLIDPAAGPVAGPESCPFTPEGFVYNPPTQTIYGFASTRQDLCVIGPDFRVAAPLDAGRTVSAAMLLDNGDAGMLLIATWDNISAYQFSAIDLRTMKSFSVPSLHGALPGFSAPHNPRIWYALLRPAASYFIREYSVTFAADGAPVFTPQVQQLAITAAGPIDDRFLYAPVIGYCSTLEGPVEGCPYGFRVFDAATLQPRADNGALAVAPLLSFGYQGPETLAPRLTGAYWLPAARQIPRSSGSGPR